MRFNYEDVNCPHCGNSQRIRFTVDSIPFGPTSIQGEEPDKCFKCNNYFKGTVKTVYSARKLKQCEQRDLEKKGLI